MTSLPIIDISPWTKEPFSSTPSPSQLAVSEQWDEAMRVFGFAIIIGHGIEDATFQQLLSEGKEFFEKPLADKMQYNHGDYGHPNGGFTPPGYETVGLSMEDEPDSKTETEVQRQSSKAKFDPVENFVFTSAPDRFLTPPNRGPLAPPFAHAQDYFQRMDSLLHTLHRLSAAALKLPDIDFFNAFYWPEDIEGKVMGRGRNGNCLRITHYPGSDHRIFSEIRKPSQATMSNDNSCSEGDIFDAKVRYGAHTDYQGFTILKPDPNDWHEHQQEHEQSTATTTATATGTVRFGGLEVFEEVERRWIPVQIPRHLNALVVNAGDLFQRWTNDRWHSALHRVVHSSVYRQSQPTSSPSEVVSMEADHLCRYSLVFFTGPVEEALIEAIEGMGMGEAKYPPIRSHDHLLMKLNRTNQR